MPDDIKLRGGEETFVITVTFDTLELYGTVEATREVTIALEK